MAKALISSVLDQLVPFVAEQLSLVTDAQKELRSFTSTLEAIQAVLKDADRKQVQDASVKRWLDQLKDVSYDMDAVLDEWNTKLGDEGKKAEKALLLKKLVGNGIGCYSNKCPGNNCCRRMICLGKRSKVRKTDGLLHCNFRI